MITLDVSIEHQVGPVLEAISGLRKQLPYATSVALNTLANDAQSAIRGSLAAEFTLRRPTFVLQTIYRKPGQDFATKSKLEASVRVNPARDILAKFEEDAVKKSRTGHALAIPIPRLQDKSLVIRRGGLMSLPNLFRAINARQGKIKGRRQRGQRGPIAPEGDVFLLTARDGRTFIAQRAVGGGPDRVGNRSRIKILYAFEKQVPIESHRLHFDTLALAAVLANSERRFDEALALAIATMR